MDIKVPIERQCCWHPMGYANGNRTGGSDHFRCCYCGTVQVLFYEIIEAQIEGHGTHVTQRVINIRTPQTACDERLTDELVV